MMKLFISLQIGLLLASYASSQFLPTTCPAVRPASCPGALRESAVSCDSELCSADQHQAMRHLKEAAEPSPTSMPPSSVPQRVQPDSSQGEQPPETAKQQQDIIHHLESLYAADPTATVPAGSAGNSAGQNPAGQIPAASPDTASTETLQETVPAGSPSSLANPAGAAAARSNRSQDERASAAKPYSGPDSQVTNRKLTFLQNSNIKIGLDMERAGVITWVSSPQMPGTWKDRNVINIWDQGRLLQQSYYGCVDGSCWATRPWLWNPVQGGSWENEPGATIKQTVVPGRYIYVEGNGRNWGKQDLVKDLIMTSNVTVKDNFAELNFAVTYNGKVTHPYMTQEVPAVFVDRRFGVLAYYAGDKPWTNDKVTYAFPGGRNIYARPTEFWAAYIDPDTGYGLGAFNPMAWMGITAYRVGDQDDDINVRPWFCSYFAHTIRMQLHPNMKTYRYKTWIVMGTLPQIRATFYKLRNTPGVMQKSRSTSEPSASGDAPGAGVATATSETQGQPDLGRNAYFGQPANYSSFKNVVPGVTVGRDEGVVQTSEPKAPVDTQSTAATAAGTAATAAERQYVATGVGAGPAGDSAAAGSQQSAANTAVSNARKIGGIVGAIGGCALLVGAAVLNRRLQVKRAAATAAVQSPSAGAAVNEGTTGDGDAATAAAAAGDEPVVAAVTAGGKKGGKRGKEGPITRSAAALAAARESAS